MLRLHYYKTFVFAALLALAGWRCEPIVTTFDDIEEAVYYRAASLVEPPPTVDTLLVMTWNIKYGGGDIDFWWACHDDRVLMTEEEVLDNLESSEFTTENIPTLARGEHAPRVRFERDQLPLFGSSVPNPAVEELKKLDPDKLTPIEALMMLYELKKKV